MMECDKQWNRQYGQLAEFKRNNGGHCNVPRGDKDKIDQALACRYAANKKHPLKNSDKKID